jgi:protein-S-isoprenylcysteine O-methyltransferase Ste14
MNPDNERQYTHGRTDMTGEHKLGDAGQLIVLALFLVVWILDSFFFKFTAFPNDHIILAVQILLGVIFLLAALYLARAGMRAAFGEVREPPSVIRTGPFKYIRHPIYLSEILFYLSLLMFRTSLAALFVWVLAIIFFISIARYEEKLLLARFGDDYKAYMKEAGMFCPKLGKKA